MDCSWTQIVCGGSLLSAVLGLSDKHAPSLTSAWHFCPLHGKLDSILGNVSLHHKQKMLGLALERRWWVVLDAACKCQRRGSH